MTSLYPDSSFIFALYVKQTHSDEAASFMESLRDPLPITTLTIFEFRQSIRLQEYLLGMDRKKGIPMIMGQTALNRFEEHLKSGLFLLLEYDWRKVLQITERISLTHTTSMGCRVMDMFHVAIALHLELRTFLTFDEKQRKLAESEGLKTPLRSL